MPKCEQCVRHVAVSGMRTPYYAVRHTYSEYWCRWHHPTALGDQYAGEHPSWALRLFIYFSTTWSEKYAMRAYSSDYVLVFLGSWRPNRMAETCCKKVNKRIYSVNKCCVCLDSKLILIFWLQRTQWKCQFWGLWKGQCGENWDNYIIRSITVLIPHLLLVA